jgi:hypothetical protein
MDGTNTPESKANNNTMSQYTSPKIGLLIAGCWLALVGLYFSLGVFFPKFRGRWGRRGQGARMSLFSQILWAVTFILFGLGAVLSAYHFAWVDRIFPFVFFPLLAIMFINGWGDNNNRDDKDVA